MGNPPINPCIVTGVVIVVISSNLETLYEMERTWYSQHPTSFAASPLILNKVPCKKIRYQNLVHDKARFMILYIVMCTVNRNCSIINNNYFM